MPRSAGVQAGERPQASRRLEDTGHRRTGTWSELLKWPQSLSRMRPDDQDLQCFRREAEAAARLQGAATPDAPQRFHSASDTPARISAMPPSMAAVTRSLSTRAP